MEGMTTNRMAGRTCVAAGYATLSPTPACWSNAVIIHITYPGGVGLLEVSVLTTGLLLPTPEVAAGGQLHGDCWKVGLTI